MIEKEKLGYLLEHLPGAFAYHKLIVDDDNTPVDYIFLDVNAAFEEMTGLAKNEVIGRRVTEALPNIKKASFDWIGTYGRVALTGETVSFESYSDPLKRWYEVTAYSDEPGYFATYFLDITSHIKEKESLESLINFSYKNLQQPFDELKYQRLTDDLLYLSGASFVVLSTYEEGDKKAVLRAISGPSENAQKVSELLGFKLEGSSWNIKPERRSNIKGKGLVRFKSLHEAGFGAISKKAALLLEKTFSLEEVYVVGIDNNDELIGDFIIFMPRGKRITNSNIIELYVNQLGITLMRNQAQKNLRQSEELFQKMLAVTPDMVSIHDPQMNIIYSNWKGFAAVPEEKRVLYSKCYKTYRGLDDICPTVMRRRF